MDSRNGRLPDDSSHHLPRRNPLLRLCPLRRHGTIDIYTVGLVVAAALLFPGIGMVLANFVREAESADAAANAITFPMMFLAGTFWPRETLPDIMKIIANFMPLTYVNDGLRDALIYAEPAQALTNTIIALGLAAFFIILGSMLMNWKEE